MAILTFKIKGQTLSIESKIDKVVENSVNYLTYKILLESDDGWEGCGINIFFTSFLGETIKFPVTTLGKSYNVPKEVIKTPGFMVNMIGSKGTKEGEEGVVITTQPIFVSVVGGGKSEGIEASETNITQSTIEALNTSIAGLGEDLTDLETALNSSITRLEKDLTDSKIALNSSITGLGDNLTNLEETLNTSIAGLEKDLTNLETALNEKEDINNKTTTIDRNSTDAQYPTAKSVYELFSKGFDQIGAELDQISDLIGGY